MEDKDIIELYWSRSQLAIAETAAKYGKQLHTLTERILYNHEDSEECINDTYHTTWNTLPPKRPDYLFAYLAKLTRNFCFGKLDYQKAKKRDAELVELSTELENCIASPNNCEQNLENRELGRLISQFLREQPQQMRQVFIRRYWYMDSINDICVSFDLSQSKVKSILFRMRGKLREYLEKEEIAL